MYLVSVVCCKWFVFVILVLNRRVVNICSNVTGSLSKVWRGREVGLVATSVMVW